MVANHSTSYLFIVHLLFASLRYICLKKIYMDYVLSELCLFYCVKIFKSYLDSAVSGR